MVSKYFLTDARGKEIYLETFDQDEALKQYIGRRQVMDCYIEEVEVCYEDLQYMTDEERIELYEAVTGEHLEKIDERFWDWAEEEIDY